MRYIKMLLFYLVACSSMVSQTSSIDNEEYYVRYSSNFDLKQNYEGAIFALLAPQESEEDKFVDNINLVKQKAIGTLDDYLNSLRIRRKELGKVYKLEMVTKGDLNYIELVLEMERQNLVITFLQNIYYKNGYTYVLTSSLEGYKENKYYDDFIKVMDSFMLK